MARPRWVAPFYGRVVRINDRGPFIRGRMIDLTPAGARALGFSSLAPVTLAVLR